MQCFVSSPCLHFSASSGHQQDLDYQSHWHLWMPAEPTSQNNFKFISLGPLKLPIVLDSSKELLCRSQRNELKTQAQLKETEHDLAIRKRVLFFLRIYALNHRNRALACSARYILLPCSLTFSSRQSICGGVQECPHLIESLFLRLTNLRKTL